MSFSQHASDKETSTGPGHVPGVCGHEGPGTEVAANPALKFDPVSRSGAERIEFVPARCLVAPTVASKEMRAAAGREEQAFVREKHTFYAGDGWSPMVHAIAEPSGHIAALNCLLEQLTLLVTALPEYTADVPPDTKEQLLSLACALGVALRSATAVVDAPGH